RIGIGWRRRRAPAGTTRVGIFRLFARPAQGGSITRFLFGLLLRDFAFHGWYVHLFLRADNLLAVNRHDLQTADQITLEAHKVHFLGRRAVNPFLVRLAIVVLVADFLRWPSFGIDHHVTVHTHQHLVVLDGVLYFRRQSLCKGLGLIEGLEVEDGRQHFAHLLSGQLRHILIELNRHHGTFCIQVLRSGAWRSHHATHTHLNVLVPLLLFLGSAIDLERD